MQINAEPAVFGAFATIRRRKRIHAHGANPAQPRRHPTHHRGDGLAAVFQDRVDKGDTLGSQRQCPVPAVTGVIAPTDQPRIDQPLADTRGIGGMHAQLRSDGAEILRSARGNHDQHTQLRARDDVLDFHDRLRHDPKQHVGGPKHRIDLGIGVMVFDSLHEPQYHPGTCVTAMFAPLHRTCLIEEEQHET